MNAVIKTGGKQYYVTEGSVIYVEKLDTLEGEKVIFDEVLMCNGQIGNPFVNAKVEGVVVKHGLQKKIKIFTYKSKDRANRKHRGHRQPYTKVEIKEIRN
ncbi:MAG: 50S ribosomal protein L21 [Bacilli bacterium]